MQPVVPGQPPLYRTVMPGQLPIYQQTVVPLQPTYQQPAPPNKKGKAGGLSISGLVISLVGLVLFAVCFAVSYKGGRDSSLYMLIPGLACVVTSMALSIVGFKKEGSNGCAIAGLVLSIIGLVLYILLLVAVAMCFMMIMEIFSGIGSAAIML